MNRMESQPLSQKINPPPGHGAELPAFAALPLGPLTLKRQRQQQRRFRRSLSGRIQGSQTLSLRSS
jgi:hypothetical protein